MKKICFLLGFLFATNVQAVIYNGTTRPDGDWNLTHAALLPHREIKMRELWPNPPAGDPNYAIIDETHVRSFVSTLPNDRSYEFDLEGNPNRPDIGLDHWHYITDPVQATALRLQMMQIIREEIPNHTIGMYGSYDRSTVVESFKAPSNKALAANAMNNLIDWQPIVALLDEIYITAYWPYQRTETDKIERWKDLNRKMVADVVRYHGRKPIAYVWHRGWYTDPPNEVVPEIFEAQLRFFACEMEVDMVFWGGLSDTEFEDWVQQMLWRFSDGCPTD